MKHSILPHTLPYLEAGIPLTDSHCHLIAILTQYPQFIDTISQLSQYTETHILDVGLSPHDWNIRTNTFKQFPFIYRSIGLHPCNYAYYTADTLYRELSPYATQAIAIGETGLDWLRMYAPKAQQISLFETHISLAKQYKRPLIIHARDSIDDVLDIIQESQLHDCYPVGVMHCFSGTIAQAKRSIELGLYISFAANISYTSAYDLQKVVQYIPEEVLLAETDAPYLLHKKVQVLSSKQPKQLPAQFSKKIIRTNTPLNLPFLYETIAQLRNSTTENIALLVKNNFYKFLSISK